MSSTYGDSGQMVARVWDRNDRSRVTTLQNTLKFSDISLTMCGTHAHVNLLSGTHSMPVVLVLM